MTTPCCTARCSVSTCVCHRQTSTAWPPSAARLVMPLTLLIRGALVVNTLEWDCANEKSARAVKSSSDRRAITANVAPNADRRTTSNHARRGGTAHTSKRATTKPGPATTRGREAAHPPSTKNLRTTTTVRCVNDAEERRHSFITRTKIATTLTSAISNPCARGATSCTTTARNTYRSSARRRHSQCPAKAGIVALNYGMKEKKLALDLECSVEEAKNLMDAYMDTYPAVRNFFDEAVAEARECGYSWTILGRRRFLQNITSSNDMDRWSDERRAVNTPIQGSAADVVKIAMNKLFYEGDLERRFGCKMVLQIHDELVFECPEEHVREVTPIIKSMMEHPFTTDLAVPLTVSLGMGKNWKDTH